MAHMIDMSNHRANIAYLGSTPWHGLGQRMQAGQSIADWAQAAGLGWHVERVQAFANVLADRSGNGIDPAVVPVHGAYFNLRSDTGAVLGTQTHTDRRVEVQPADILAFLNRYISVDDRFAMDVAGSIKGGATIWATAAFNGDVSVAGEQHRAYLLARTSFDGSSGTILQCTMVRVVCNNTLTAAYGDKRAMVTVRHTVKFDPATAAQQLAAMASSVDSYKSIGDALAANVMSELETVNLFRKLLDIPADATSADISTRKLNAFNQLAQAYETSVQEGAPRGTAWTALQSVTRFVDHDRTVRGDEAVSAAEKRFTSAQFGSGETMKQIAWGELAPRVRELVTVG